MIPQTNSVYSIELCSGEVRRWRCLSSPTAEGARWWRDLESGREFSEQSLLYAWRIVACEDDAGPDESRPT